MIIAVAQLMQGYPPAAAGIDPTSLTPVASSYNQYQMMQLEEAAAAAVGSDVKLSAGTPPASFPSSFGDENYKTAVTTNKMGESAEESDNKLKSAPSIDKDDTSSVTSDNEQLAAIKATPSSKTPDQKSNHEESMEISSRSPASSPNTAYARPESKERSESADLSSRVKSESVSVTSSSALDLTRAAESSPVVSPAAHNDKHSTERDYNVSSSSSSKDLVSSTPPVNNSLNALVQLASNG